MDRIILRHGPTRALITDRGTNFMSALFAALCKALKVKPLKTTETGMFNKKVTEMVRKYIENGFEKWEDILELVAFSYNNSTHSSTSETPYFLNHSRDPVMTIDQFLFPHPLLVLHLPIIKSR